MSDKPKMKDCFGLGFGGFMEDLLGDYDVRLKCYECPDYDKCYQMTIVKALTQTRYEIRRAAGAVGRALGGSHSSWPFG